MMCAESGMLDVRQMPAQHEQIAEEIERASEIGADEEPQKPQLER